MGGLIQTYRTGGALSSIGSGSGNTGVPLGPVDDWAGLAAIPPKENALVNVESLGTGNSNGIAIYDGAQWQLYSGIFDSVADMNAFAEPIATGALASVEETGDDNENAVRYQYDGAAWARTAALTAGFAWTLSSLFDFSAVGLQDGDFGVWTPTGSQPILLRYKAACAFAGGGTRPAWMTPIAYAGTPVLQAWTDGTEDNAALAAQGWTVVTDTGCTVTATGGFQRFATDATATAARLRCLIAGATSSTRMETIFQTRASTSSTATQALCALLADGTNVTVFGQAGTHGVGFKDALFGGPMQTPTRNNAAPQMPTLAQDAATFVVRDEGRTVLSSASRGGLPLGNYRRDLQSSPANLMQVSAQGQSGIAATMDYRGQVLTY